MEKKQTAVEWLWNINQDRELQALDFDQALQMEKEQISEAYNDGCDERHNEPVNGQQYYTETYNKQS